MRSNAAFAKACSASAGRAVLLPLAPQVTQVRNTVLVERQTVTLPLDHAFGFELADVGPAAIECCASADALMVAGFLDSGREAGFATDGLSVEAISAIVLGPIFGT